ncbi:MAG TPA: DUF308 domain-containing protein [Sphingomicrobium sp.]|jgi:uncharacterized membrane protein HdeD (DUF308 family)|nr:DUF308 domain-containing protein [Sphingomicrobium sp.]
MASDNFILPAHNWKWFMLRGVLALLLGAGAIVFPLSAVFAFTMLFAAYSLIDGVASLVAGARGATEPGHRWGALVFSGIIGILIGVLFLLMPLVATITYSFVVLVMLAAWAIATGVLEVVAAIRLRREIEGEWLLGISGAISVLLGIGVIVLIIPYPAASILSAAWLIAMFAFGSGIVLVAQALRLRRRVVGRG